MPATKRVRLFGTLVAAVVASLIAPFGVSSVAAETLRGKVVGVTDGDTVRLLVGGRDLHKVRLGEIDAPESGQPFGRASKQMLSDLVFGQTVTARVTDVDRYGRSVAVLSRGTANINAEMVRRGGAWAYRRYLSDQRYLLWEQQARDARRGLWRLQADQIMAPWDWRAARRGGGQRGDREPGDPFTGYDGQGRGPTASAATSRWAPTAAASTGTGAGPACGPKRLCRQMASCAEARYHLRVCGVTRLDGNGDGVPCEKLCG